MKSNCGKSGWQELVLQFIFFFCSLFIFFLFSSFFFIAHLAGNIMPSSKWNLVNKRTVAEERGKFLQILVPHCGLLKFQFRTNIGPALLNKKK